MQPKTEQRLINFRKYNRKLPRRRQDIPADKITYTHPEVLIKFCTETGKILPRRITGVPAWMHRRITRAIKQSRSVNLM